jgi:ABC-2 type transport system permease protein
MTVQAFRTVAAIECLKLAAQVKTRLVLAACAVGPFAFAAVLRVQSTLPEDTLFGRAVKDSGFAVPLVVLGFAAVWALPVVASVVGGDVFSSEDRYGTWPIVLTRSCSRSDVFAGKALTALGFSSLAVGTLATGSIVAGALVIGTQPVINLSGVLLTPRQALGAVALAWLSVLPPVLAFTALAVLVSTTTRSSVASLGVPVAVAMAMQLYGLVDGPESFRRLLITSAFGAWHGVWTEPHFYAPLFNGTMTSAAYCIVCLTSAFRTVRRRDIGG